MPKLHFTTGHVTEIDEYEYKGFLKRLHSSNMKYWKKRSTGDLIFLNSPALAWLERELAEKPEVPEPVEEPEEATVEEVLPEEPKKDPAEVALEEMVAKSNCHKNKHEGQNQIIYQQDITTKHGAGKRYFPVCEFCGFKGRFIAADKLSDEVKEAAKVWKE